MMERTFVLIFLFWAILTIVTPKLILLSENSKHNLNSDGKRRKVYTSFSVLYYAFLSSGFWRVLTSFERNFAVERSEGMKARRMMGYTEKRPRKTPIALPLILEAPAPGPAPAPSPARARARALTPVLRLEKLS
ncbi:hypothetical protein SLA2020_441950 [Shorea laevis]